MPALAEIPASGPLASIVKATQRLNPCMELDVDVLAVTRAAVASTPADWSAGTLSSTSPDTKTGLLRLTATTPQTLFSQTNSSTIHHFFRDSVNGQEEYALDFFPSPSVTQGVPFTLDSLDLHLNAGNLKGFFRVQVSYYDQNWRVVPMGDPIDILSGDVILAVGPSGGIYKIDFTALGRRFVFPGGFQNTVTGSGFDGTNSRTANVDAKGISHLNNIPRGLSISIQPMGRNFDTAWIGCIANGTAAQFDTSTFWRHAANRECGPYNPDNQPYTGNTTDHNPDNYLITGAVPGFGAKSVTNGSWGIARRIPTAQRAQNVSFSWEQPYHVLRVLAYPSSGTAVNVLDMGGVPVNPVELRLDDVQPQGTSLAYVLKGSNTSSTGPWTAISANTDGSILTGGDLYRWYQLTTTFTPGPSGATKYASPALQAWMMVERVALSTYRYLKDFDSTVTADPVTGQSGIAELKLPVMNAGRQDFRDLAAQLGSNYAPSGLEAHVYARNTRSGVRYFLNSYRLENRDPQFGAEEMTFVSGMDRLTPKIPAPSETFRYPSSLQVAITNVTNVGAIYTITVAGTPFTIGALAGYRMHGVTGACAGIDYAIINNATTSQFTVNIASGAIPVIGDTFEIHSDITTRVGAAYASQDFAAVYTDLLAVQAAVPARYRGRLPATTGRTTTYTLPADGVKALDVLQDIALHCGGFPAWDKGRIQFVDFYGKKESVVTWEDRHIVTLETPVGADRRMPRVRVKYGYQPDTQKFTNQATYEDFDTLLGWAPANLFDVFEPPDDFCKWNDVSEAKFVSDTFQKAWKSGVRLWKVKTVLNYPWLAQGDAVTILTDQYTDRRLSYSADGVTDLGTPIAGRTSSVAVIVGKNLWGNEFVVAVRGLDQVTSSAVATTGTVAVPAVGTQAPVATITPLNTETDDTVWNLQFSATPGSGGGGANLTYAIKQKSGVATDSLLSSGNATAFPLTLSVARDLRTTKQLRFSITDTLTGLGAQAVFTIPSQRLEIDLNGHLVRARSFDDGDYGLRATNTTGLAANSSVSESGGKAINRLLGKALAGDADSLDGVPEGTTYNRIISGRVSSGKPLIDFAEAIHFNKNIDNVADGSTYARTITSRVSSGKPLIDFAEAIHANKNIDNVADGPTYARILGSRLSSGTILRSGALSDGDYAARATNTTGLNLHTSVLESGGKAVNRLLGKTLAGDADSLDGVPEGTSYKRVTVNAVDGSSNIDFSKSGFANKNVDNVSDGTTWKRIHNTSVDGSGFPDMSKSGWSNKHLGNVADDAGSDRRAATAAQKTGGDSAAIGMYTNGHVRGSVFLPPLNNVGGWGRQVVSNANRADMATTNITSSGSTISIGSFGLVLADDGNVEKFVSYNAGTCTQQITGLNYIYANDAANGSNWGGGTVTFFSTTLQSFMSQSSSVFYVGKITTTAGTVSSGNIGGPICVAPETMILVCDSRGRNQREIRADQVRVGDFVWTQQDRGRAKMGAFPVVQADLHPEEMRARIIFQDGRMLRCSSMHRLRLMTGRWSEAQFLRPGERVIGHPIGVVEDVYRMFDIGPVVHLKVRGARTYISNGLLSHNLKAY